MSGGTEVVVDGIRWSLTPAGRKLLEDDDLKFETHLSTGRATVVKHGEHRTVYRVALDGGVVYWKHCRLNGSRAWWREAFRGPKAKLEFERAQSLTERGIATVEPLAWGKFDQRWPKGSFLITRAVAGVVPLDECLVRDPPTTPAAYRQMAAALADYVSRLHDAGVVHPDFHPGNILIRPDRDGPTFFLIDLHDLTLGQPVSPHERRANLIQFNRWFQLRTSRTDRLRFWRAYRGGLTDTDAKAIESDTARSSVRLWRSRDQRPVLSNRHFARVSNSGVTGHAVRDLEPAAIQDLLANPDAPFESPGVVLLKDSRSTTACELTVRTPDGPRVMVYKRFRVSAWSDPLANLLRKSPALRSWLNGHALLARGLPTPRPWLVLHQRRFGLKTAGYLLCEKVPDAIHLHAAIEKADTHCRRRLTEALARWVRLMHERSASHRDLKATNVLVTATGEVQFIDLVGARTGRVTRRLRVRDLTRLNASFVQSPHLSRTDRLRFLRIYLLWSLRGREGWKDWWRQIDEGTREKVQRNARRGRPLA